MTTFRPITTLDQEWPLAPTTLRVKRALNELQVRAVIVPRADRLAICATMGWDPEGRIVDELTEPEYYTEVARLLFPAAPIDEHVDDIDQGVVATAAHFFRSASYGMK